MAAVTLSSVSSTLLPPTITEPIFAKVLETSAVMRLARQVPLSVTAATAIPIPMNVPLASWVGEGSRKAVDGSGMSVKTMVGKKIAVLVPVSQEVVNTNAASLWNQLQQDVPVAISRGFDYAAIHGRSLDGGNGPFADSLVETANSVTLGTASQATGGLYSDIVAGEALVENGTWDFSGFAASPRIRTILKQATTTYGQPIFVPDVISGVGSIGDGGSGSGTLDGFPIAYNRGVDGVLRRQSNVNSRIVLDAVTATDDSLVSATAVFSAADVGKTVVGDGIFSGSTISTYTNPTTVVLSHATTATATGVTVSITGAADTKLRAIGGDWSQCAYGVGMDLSVRLSNQASYVDADGTTHSAFQENLVLLLVEAYYGFVVGETAAFVKYVVS